MIFINYLLNDRNQISTYSRILTPLVKLLIDYNILHGLILLRFALSL